MNRIYIFDGIAPTYDFSNTLIVLGFEILTLAIELGLFYFLFRKQLDSQTMKKALLAIYGANITTFFVGAILYSAFFGFDWLFTGMYYGYQIVYPVFYAFSALISFLILPFLALLIYYTDDEEMQSE